MSTTPAKAVSLYPWPRFFGRYLDYLIVGTAFGLALEFAVPGHPILQSSYLLGWLSALAWIPLEGLCLCTIGTTPGKVLLGMSVQTAEGHQLSSGQALRRSVSAWLTGCAALLPLVSLITMNSQYNRLRIGQQASWDRDGGFQVVREPLSFARKLVLVGVVALFLFMIALGGSAVE